MKQLALLDGRVSEMVSVEEASTADLPPEVDPPLDTASLALGDLALSPFIWSAVEGLSDEFWSSVGLPPPAVVDTGPVGSTVDVRIQGCFLTRPS